MKSKKIGILNEGKNNRFINNTFSGFDIAIHDKGKNTMAAGNFFNNQRSINEWYEMWWVKYLLLPVVVVIVAAGILWMLSNIWAIIKI